MNKLEADLKRGWFAFALPGYRNHAARFVTYSLFDYEALPPIDERLDDRFDWLLKERPHVSSLEGEPVDEEVAEEGYIDTSIEDKQAFFHKFAALISHPGLHLPKSFIAFMQTPELQKRVRSCTACYLQLPDHLVKTRGKEDCFLFHFLSDQQWCLHWYLYVNSSGEQCVIVSPKAYGFALSEDEPQAERSVSSSRDLDLSEEAEVWLCAPSFSAFIYRFWLENEIWFALAYDKQPLTARQRAYAEHYKRSTE